MLVFQWAHMAKEGCDYGGIKKRNNGFRFSQPQLKIILESSE